MTMLTANGHLKGLPRFWLRRRLEDGWFMVFDRDRQDKYCALLNTTGGCVWSDPVCYGLDSGDWHDSLKHAMEWRVG